MLEFSSFLWEMDLKLIATSSDIRLLLVRGGAVNLNEWIDEFLVLFDDIALNFDLILKTGFFHVPISVFGFFVALELFSNEASLLIFFALAGKQTVFKSLGSSL